MMKYFPICLLVLLGATFPLLVNPQDSHVHSEYIKDIKKTKVTTDLMYVVNAPAQFVQVQLSSLYQGEKLAKPPSTITLLIWSYSREAMYRKEKGKKLFVVTDGGSWLLGRLDSVVMKGETKKGQDAFYSENNPALGMQVPLPMHAQVRGGKNVNGLVMEWMFVDLKPEQLSKLVNAKKVALQLGDATFEFTSDQMNTVREFAKRITP
jgi:hypothetical protein